MNYLLKRILVGVCVALVMMSVHKLSHAVGVQYVQWTSALNSSAKPTASAACAATGTTLSFTVSPVPSSNGQFSSGTCMYSNGGSVVVSSIASCVDGSGLLRDSGGNYYCAAPVCTAGTTAGVRYDSGPRNRSAANTPALPTNYGGCGVKLTAIGTCSANAGDTSPNPHLYCNATVTRTGAQAPTGSDDMSVPSTGAPANPEPVQTQGNSDGSCPSGTANIGTDSSGTPICRGNGTSSGPTKNTSTTTPTTTTTNGDGSTTTSSSTSNGNNDGSTTTTTTACTTATNGVKSCSITGTTSSNASGGSGKSDGKPDDPKDFCALHPDLTVCVNATVGGGGCTGASANLSFTGDAIEGAILRKMRDDTCANLLPSASKDLGNNLLTGHDPMQSQIDQAQVGDSVDLSQEKLDQSGFLGGGACLSDRSLSFAGHAVPVHFSSICQNILPLRYVIISCALLVAYLIVSKSVLQG